MKTMPNGVIQVSTILSVSPKRHPKTHRALLAKPETLRMATYLCFLLENGIPESGVVLPQDQEEDLSGLAEEL